MISDPPQSSFWSRSVHTATSSVRTTFSLLYSVACKIQTLWDTEQERASPSEVLREEVLTEEVVRKEFVETLHGKFHEDNLYDGIVQRKLTTVYRTTQGLVSESINDYAIVRSGKLLEVACGRSPQDDSEELGAMTFTWEQLNAALQQISSNTNRKKYIHI